MASFSAGPEAKGTTMGSAPLPQGYVETGRGRDRIVFQEAHRGALEAMDLTDLDSLREGALGGSHRGRSRHFSIDIGGGVRAVVKESRRGGLRRWLFDDIYFGDGRFLLEIRVTTEAERKGIRVAPIIASVTRPAGLGFCRHHYLIRELEGAVDLRERLETARPEEFAGWRQVIRSVAIGVRSLHDSGICHADLNLGNILIFPGAAGTPPEVGFVDLDTSRIAEVTSAGKRARNLLRLYRSVLKAGRAPSRTDLARFTLAYHGGDRSASRRAWSAFRRGRILLSLHGLLWRIGLR